MNSAKSRRRRYESRNAITANPLTAAESIPAMNTPVEPEGNPSRSRSTPLYRPAPAMIGIDNRNENRAAAARSSFNSRPAVIVTPDLDTPGCRAIACATPRISPWFTVTSSIPRVWAIRRSTR